MPLKIYPAEIWEVELKDTVGHEQKGRRPAIVICVHCQTDLCMVVPLTSQPTASTFPYSYLIKKSGFNGLSMDSVAMIFQLRSLSVKNFLTKIGSIESVHFNQIKVLIKDFMKL